MAERYTKLARKLRPFLARSSSKTGTSSTVQAASPNLLSADQVLQLLLTVDGIGSGLDADFLDGLSGGSFALASHTHAWQPHRMSVDSGTRVIPAGHALVLPRFEVPDGTALEIEGDGALLIL